MPELPEVETVMRGLAPVLEGARIAKASVNRPDLRWPFPPRMAERLTGAQITGLRRRAKYILADLDTGEALLIHLGMSGRMLISGDPLGRFVHDHPPVEKHDHVVLDLGNGARITFNDPRRFGAMDLIPAGAEQTHKLLAAIGPEPLGNEFHEDYLTGALARRNTPIKSALLDQRIVAGLGNIYVLEALHRAGLSPVRKAGRIAKPRIAALVPHIRATLAEAIEAGGSSLRDYRRTDGELGYFQHTFRVYGRAGQGCHAAGCGGTIRRIVQAGRSSYYCPICQR